MYPCCSKKQKNKDKHTLEIAETFLLRFYQSNSGFVFPVTFNQSLISDSADLLPPGFRYLTSFTFHCFVPLTGSDVGSDFYRKWHHDGQQRRLVS